MKNVTQITAIARIKGKKNTAKMLRELYEQYKDGHRAGERYRDANE